MRRRAGSGGFFYREIMEIMKFFLKANNLNVLHDLPVKKIQTDALPVVKASLRLRVFALR
jgi:hypothetical protein